MKIIYFKRNDSVPRVNNMIAFTLWNRVIRSCDIRSANRTSRFAYFYFIYTYIHIFFFHLNEHHSVIAAFFLFRVSISDFYFPSAALVRHDDNVCTTNNMWYTYTYIGTFYISAKNAFQSIIKYTLARIISNNTCRQHITRLQGVILRLMKTLVNPLDRREPSIECTTHYTL